MTDTAQHLANRRRVPVVRDSRAPVAKAAEVAAVEWTAAKSNIGTLQLGQTRTNLRSAGLSLDGTTDETAALQSIIDAASPGEILVLDERANLRISDQVGWSGKAIGIEGYGDATIESTAVMAVPLLQITNAPGSHINRLTVKGAETSYVGANSQQYAVTFTGSDGASVNGLTMSGTSRGLLVETSDHTHLSNVAFTGFVTQWVTNVNWHTTLDIANSHSTRIDGVSGENVGSTLLVGVGSNRGTVDRLLSHNAFDNAVYISGGEAWQLSNPIAYNDEIPTAGGAGIKMRGANHALIGGYIENVMSGIALTDQNGAGGFGSRAIGVRVRNTRLLGAGIEEHYGINPNDMAILYCHFENCNTAADPAMASVRVRHGEGHQVIGNSIANQAAGRAGILVEGGDGNAVVMPTVALNKLRHVGAIGVRFGYAVSGFVALNELRTVTGTFGVLLDTGANSNDVYGNRALSTVGTVAGIRAVGDTNRITQNPRMTVQSLGTGNVMYGNANGNPVVTGATTDERLASLEAILQTQRLIS